MKLDRRWGAPALLLLSLAAYLPAMRAGFLLDDVSVYLLENPLVRAPDGLFRFWFTTQPVDYYPVTNSLLWCEWRLWGEHPAGYHIVNLLLHAAVALLLWRVLRQLAVPGGWLAAALFAVHPVGVETVAWISQGKNTLSMSFFLASLLYFLRFDAGRVRRWYWASFGLFLLAVLAKTGAVTLPVVMLGSVAVRRRRLAGRDLLGVLPFLAAAALLGAVAASFQARIPGAMEAAAEPFATRLAAAGWIVWFYLYKAVLPLGLAFVYPRLEVDPRSLLSWVPGAALVAVFAVAWWRRRGWGAALLAGLGLYVVNLLPVLGFVGIGFMASSRAADHWQYAALPAFLALAASAGARAVSGRPAGVVRAGGAVAIAVLVVLAGLTWRQASLYVDEERLWRDNLSKNPRAWFAHNSLGKVLVNRGRLSEAETCFATALRLVPNYSDALVNLGNVLDDQGRTTEAIPYYERALRVSPPDGVLHYNMAVALEKLGRLLEAAEHYRRSLQLQPDDPDTRQRLAAVLQRIEAAGRPPR